MYVTLHICRVRMQLNGYKSTGEAALRQRLDSTLMLATKGSLHGFSTGYNHMCMLVEEYVPRRCEQLQNTAQGHLTW